MSIISKLTTLGAAGSGGESFWRLELKHSSYPTANDITLEYFANEVLVLNDGTIVTPTINQASNEPIMVSVAADGTVNNLKSYQTSFTSSSSAPLKLNGLLYSDSLDQGIVSMRPVDANSSNPVAGIARVSSSGSINSIYRKDNAYDSYRLFNNTENGTAYYYNGYYYRIGRETGATDFLYVFNANSSNGNAPKYRISLSGHAGSICHIAGYGNKLALADNKMIHYLELASDGSASVLWSKYFTDGQVGGVANESFNAPRVVCHVDSLDNVYYWGWNRQRTFVYKFNSSGTKLSSKTVVSGSNSPSWDSLGASATMLSSDSSYNGLRLFTASKALFYTNGPGYSFRVWTDSYFNDSPDWRSIGFDRNTNAMILVGRVYNGSNNGESVVIYRLPSYDVLVNNGGIGTLTNSSNQYFNFFTDDTVYEPTVNSNSLSLNTSSNSSEFGYKGSATSSSYSYTSTITTL